MIASARTCALPRLGLVGKLDGEAVAVGNLELMEELFTNLPEDLNEKVASSPPWHHRCPRRQGQRLLGCWRNSATHPRNV